MSTQRRLYRSTQDRMFAGVCGGIAEYLDVDPTLVRLVFVALALMGGPGPIIYIVLMLIVPENPREGWKRKRGETDDLEDGSATIPSIPVSPDDAEMAGDSDFASPDADDDTETRTGNPD